MPFAKHSISPVKTAKTKTTSKRVRLRVLKRKDQKGTNAVSRMLPVYINQESTGSKRRKKDLLL
jgi:hypothetical protein